MTGRVRNPLLELVLALACVAVISTAAAQSRPADPVYQVSAAATSDSVRITWTIADGHHLFANKFRFESATPGVSLGTPRLPTPDTIKDDFLGDIQVYTGKVTVELPLSFSDTPPPAMDLAITAQGCAIGGDCFAPDTRALSLDIPAVMLAESSPPPAASPAGSSTLSSPLSALMELGQAIGGAGETEFLDPEVAFQLSAEAREDDTIVASWQIADGYYLYRKRFKFTPVEPAGLELGEARLPAGKMKNDEYFGDMEVYYGKVQAVLPVQGMRSSSTPVTLDVVYQGCADAGLCYPPITKRVSLSLPPEGGLSKSAETPEAASPAPGAPSAVVDLPEQDRIARSLLGGNMWLVLLSFVGFGLLLTFTPCVFPMIPILSSIIVGQGEDLNTRKAFTLSLTYVLAMSATYTAAGVIAGTFGANLTATFQNPWVLITFSLVFVLLALSMFGFYDLQIPAGWQAKLTSLSNRQQGGTYAGVAIMGFLSALIVGPCVAAPLAGALIYIGQTGDAVLGGMALFALSIGMGLPVLVVGTSAGKLLPKAGAWMNAVKAVFGIALLGVAIYLLERLVPAWVSLSLWGVLLMVAAIYLGALDTIAAEAGGWRRFRKGTGLVLLLYGALLVVGASSGGDDVFQPLKGLASRGNGEPQQELAFQRIKGVSGLRAALDTAAALGKPVMLDYYADWCVSCKEMERYTFSDPGVQAALANTVLLQADVTANDAEDQALLKRFNLFGPPAILFFGPDGRERPSYRVVGFMKAERFRQVVEKATVGDPELRAGRERRQLARSE